MNTQLDTFINQLLDEKKLSGVSDIVRATLVEDLKKRLLDQINRALIDALPPERIDLFNRMLDSETISEEEVQRFIVDSKVDVQRVTMQTMLRFAELYLGPKQA